MATAARGEGDGKAGARERSGGGGGEEVSSPVMHKHHD
jgi:hypothetical protein